MCLTLRCVVSFSVTLQVYIYIYIYTYIIIYYIPHLALNNVRPHQNTVHSAGDSGVQNAVVVTVK